MKPRAKTAVPTITFRAEIGRIGTFASVAVPARVTRDFAPWGAARRITVTGSLNASPFHGTLLPTAQGGHVFFLNATTRREADVAVGDRVTFVLSPCPADTVLLSADVAAALDAEPGARAAFDALAVSYRKQLLRFVTTASTPAARARAIARTVDHCLGRPDAPPSPSPSRARRPVCPLCGGRDAADGTEHPCTPPDLAASFAKAPAALTDLFARLTAVVEDCGLVATVAFPIGAGFVAERRFLTVMPRKSWLELGFYLTHRLEHARVRRIDTLAPDSHIHRVRLASEADLDDWLRERIDEAYVFGCRGEPDRGFGERPEV